MASKNRPGFGSWGKPEKRGKKTYYSWKIRVAGRPIVLKRADAAALEKAVAAKISELQAKGFLEPASSDPTVQQHLTQWLEHKIKPGRENNTYVSYEGTCRLYIFPCLGTVRLSKLGAMHLARLAADVKRQGLSGRTAEYACQVLLRGLPKKMRVDLRAAMEDAEVEMPRGNPQRKRVFDEGEIAAILAKAYERVELKTRPGEWRDRFRDRHLLRLKLNIGTRISELLAIHIVDVNLRERAVVIGRQWDRVKSEKTGRKEWELKDKLKSDAEGESRLAFLNDAALEAVEGQLALVEHYKQVAGEGYDDHGLLFPSETGRPMHSRSVRRALAAILAEVRIDGVLISDVKLHDFRRTFGTYLAEAEPRRHLHAASLGHKRVSTSEQYYIAARDLVRRAAVINLTIGAKKEPEKGKEKEG